MRTEHTKPCVCVETALQESGDNRPQKQESQDSGTCVTAHKRHTPEAVNNTTTVTLHFASRVVERLIDSTSTLLVQSWVGK